MRKLIALFALFSLAVALLIIGGCSSNDGGTGPYGSTSPPPATPNTINLSGSAFNPATITVARGTTVTWKNNDGMTHTSTSDTGVWDTGDIVSGGTKTTTFNTAGTFPFHCIYHAGMKGTVVVQ